MCCICGFFFSFVLSQQNFEGNNLQAVSIKPDVKLGRYVQPLEHQYQSQYKGTTWLINWWKKNLYIENRNNNKRARKKKQKKLMRKLYFFNTLFLSINCEHDLLVQTYENAKIKPTNTVGNFYPLFIWVFESIAHTHFGALVIYIKWTVKKCLIKRSKARERKKNTPRYIKCYGSRISAFQSNQNSLLSKRKFKWLYRLFWDTLLFYSGLV